MERVLLDILHNRVKPVKHDPERWDNPQSYDGDHEGFPGERSGRDLPPGAVADVLAPYGSKNMPGSPSCGGTTCQQPDKDEAIRGFSASYFPDWRATNRVIAVNTDRGQCHDINSKAREHGEEPR
ncbi:hypothetical protein OS493_032926 [Desmophyllum pertusum]|uniref:Uncharacterized protein n=1 Tax=Desmophyllum pertusum TaxID=174260 RepID=A0A9W9YJH3_9CNID|nr:hypothetical protein OS493_032926 [Desmophyllum pertusum]